LHFNTVRQVAARLRAKSAIYDFLVFNVPLQLLLLMMMVAVMVTLCGAK